MSFKLKVGEGQGSKRKGKYTGKTKKLSDLTPEEIKQMKLDEPMGSPAKQTLEEIDEMLKMETSKDYSKWEGSEAAKATGRTAEEERALTLKQLNEMKTKHKKPKHKKPKRHTTSKKVT